MANINSGLYMNGSCRLYSHQSLEQNRLYYKDSIIAGSPGQSAFYWSLFPTAKISHIQDGTREEHRVHRVHVKHDERLSLPLYGKTA
jgi:hypothetical protein